MPKGVPHSWPDLDKVIALVREFGQVKAAKQLGVSRSTLQSHLDAQRVSAEDRQKTTDPMEIEGGVSEEERLRQRNEELEKALREKRKTDVFEERLLVALSEGIAARTPRYTPRPLKHSDGGSKHEMALLWSDTHYPEVVSAAETNGINEYNSAIMWKRHEVLRERLASHVEQRKFTPGVLHLWVLGDMLSGNIHDELEISNEMPIAGAAMQFAEDAATWIESLFEIGFSHINFTGVVGNHPRLHRKPRAKHAFDNWDWVAYRAIQLALRKYDNITFQLPAGNMQPVIVARRWRALLWHGDGVRTTMPGVPWGGIVRRATALQNEFTAAGMPLDYFAVGHWHQANDVQVGRARAYMNGSIKGPDEYGLKAFGGAAPAQQLLLTFHEKHGCVGTSYLDLDRPSSRPHLELVAA